MSNSVALDLPITCIGSGYWGRDSPGAAAKIINLKENKLSKTAN